MRTQVKIMLVMILLLCLTPLGAQAATATSVYINGIELSNDAPYLYQNGKEAQTSAPSGTTGYAYFQNGTLTLYRFTCTAATSTIGLRADGDLTVLFSGTNRISGGGSATNNTWGISVDGHLTIEGTAAGALTVDAGSATESTYGMNSYGIEADALTIRGNCGVKATGGSAKGASYGIRTGALVKEGGCTLTATGGAGNTSFSSDTYSYGVYATSAQITNGYIAATASTADYSYGFFCYNDFSLSGSGRLKAVGGSNTSITKSFGLYCLKEISMNGKELTAEGKNAKISQGIFTRNMTVNAGAVTVSSGASSGVNDNYHEYGSWGIECEQTLTVNGGTMKVTGGTSNTYGSGWGIEAKTIRMTGGTLVSKSGTSVNFNAGIETYSLEMSGGKITATGAKSTGSTSNGLRVTGPASITGSVSITGTGGISTPNASIGIVFQDGPLVLGDQAVVKGVGSSGLESYGVLMGRDVGTVTIKDQADVIAQSGTATEYSYGLYCQGCTVNISGSASVTAASGKSQYNSTGLYATTMTVSGNPTLTASCTVGEGLFAVTGTFNGGTINCSGTNYGIRGSNLTFSGTADVTASAQGASCYGIRASESLRISGSAAVYATAGSAEAEECWGVYAGRLMIDSPGASLTAEGGETNNGYSYGLSIGKSSTGVGYQMTGGSLTATGGMGRTTYGIYSNTANTNTVSGGTLLAKSGAGTSAARALNVQPDLSGYYGARITVSDSSSGSPAAAYSPTSTSYKYFKVEEGPGAAVDASSFPDEIFRAYVSVNFDANGDGLLSRAEMAAVTKINVDAMGIASLKGVEIFAGLEELSCGNNQLTSLDLSHNAHINSLVCDNNVFPITVEGDRTFDLTALPGFDAAKASGWAGGTVSGNILTVDAGAAQVTYSYDCSNGHTAVFTLKVDAPAVPGIAIDAANFPDAALRNYVSTNFDADKNGELSDAEIAAATEIRVDGMGIASLTGVEHFKALTLLYCRDNQLKVLDVSQNPLLWSLDCGNNRLTSLDLSGNASLSSLRCDGNLLTIQVDQNRSFDLSALPGFDAGKASGWKNGAVNGSILTVADNAAYATYTYDCGQGKTAVFTLIVDNGRFALTRNSSGNFSVTLYGTVETGLMGSIRELASGGAGSGWTFDSLAISSGAVLNCSSTLDLPAKSVVNHGTIADGYLRGADVQNYGLITGGCFSMVTNLEAGRIEPALEITYSNDQLSVTSTFDCKNETWQWYLALHEGGAREPIDGADSKTICIPAGMAGYFYPVQTANGATYEGPCYVTEDSGYCGPDNARWQLVGSTLTISGGDTRSDDAPGWSRYTPGISTVVLNGVTHLRNNAFNSSAASRLTSVDLGGRLISIGDHAFANCTALKTLTIPLSVTSIGADAFSGASAELTIRCHEDSAAHTYALEAGIRTDVEEHTPIIVSGTPASCTAPGLTEGKVCALCQKVLAVQEEIPVLDHTCEEWTRTSEPDCEAAGSERGVCTACGTELTREVPALGHTQEVDAAVAPTCTSEGLTEGAHCSACGEIFTAQEVLEKLPHTEEIDEAVDAACTVPGLTEGKHCSVCGMVLVAQEQLPPTGHQLVPPQVTPASGSSNGGIGAIVCSVCNVTVAEAATIHHDRVMRLPAMLTTLDAQALSGTNAEQITLGGQVRTIGSRAFANCTALKLVVLPGSVTSIAEDAFSGSGQVVLLCREGSYAHSYAIEHGLRYALMN